MSVKTLQEVDAEMLQASQSTKAAQDLKDKLARGLAEARKRLEEENARREVADLEIRKRFSQILREEKA